MGAIPLTTLTSLRKLIGSDRFIAAAATPSPPDNDDVDEDEEASLSDDGTSNLLCEKCQTDPTVSTEEKDRRRTRTRLLKHQKVGDDGADDRTFHSSPGRMFRLVHTIC